MAQLCGSFLLIKFVWIVSKTQKLECKKFIRLKHGEDVSFFKFIRSLILDARSPAYTIHDTVFASRWVKVVHSSIARWCRRWETLPSQRSGHTKNVIRCVCEFFLTTFCFCPSFFGCKWTSERSCVTSFFIHFSSRRTESTWDCLRRRRTTNVGLSE